jgi:hydrogenase nickel incorporation protein HypB
MPVPEQRPILVLERKVLARNDEGAAANRRFFLEQGILAVNIMSAPGSGKTRLLEATLTRLVQQVPVAVIEGDVETDNDARRVARHGVPVVQLMTRGACHLEASLVAGALERLPAPRGGIVFIENVGNLICPASFDLGEALRAVCVSVTEGDDKPEKYPAMFRKAEAVVLTKCDLLPHVDFDAEKAIGHARALNPDLRAFRTSAVTGEGLEAWCEYLVARTREAAASST